MKFAVTGSTGMIGSAVREWLRQRGHQVNRLVRPQSSSHEPQDIPWDFEKKTIALDRLEGHDVVAHFAGANIADRRWTPRYKKLIYDSRVEGTRFLAESVTKLRRPPKLFLSASAVGYYGDHPERTPIDEAGDVGKGFLAEVCRDWELAAKSAQQHGIRVVPMRFGMVLDTRGGALAKMLPVFQWGLGGPIGSGKQMISWIALWEIPQIVYYLSQQDKVNGPVNVVAQQAVTNQTFAKTLGHILSRPAVLPFPKAAVSLVFGEMGRELLLNGATVVPQRLQELGNKFAYPDLKSALTSILK